MFLSSPVNHQPPSHYEKSSSKQKTDPKKQKIDSNIVNQYSIFIEPIREVMVEVRERRHMQHNLVRKDELKKIYIHLIQVKRELEDHFGFKHEEDPKED